MLQLGISGIKSKAKRAHIADRQDKNPESPTDTTRHIKAEQAREQAREEKKSGRNKGWISEYIIATELPQRLPHHSHWSHHVQHKVDISDPARQQSHVCACASAKVSPHPPLRDPQSLDRHLRAGYSSHWRIH